MDGGTPRLRMFAGPNGSGKSTLKSELRDDLLGHYINADEILLSLTFGDGLDLSVFGIEVSKVDIQEFFRKSSLLKITGLLDDVDKIEIDNRRVQITRTSGGAYLSSVLADYFRRQLIQRRASFSFETVMSSRDKVELFRTAQAVGYRTYLYFVATEDPEINISRVQNRVLLGGHDVPHDKIIARYF